MTGHHGSSQNTGDRAALLDRSSFNRIPCFSDKVRVGGGGLHGAGDRMSSTEDLLDGIYDRRNVVGVESTHNPRFSQSRAMNNFSVRSALRTPRIRSRPSVRAVLLG